MTALQYILPLVISAFTGWIVIRLSITFLFRPHKPLTVAGFKIQGIIPANQQQVAEKIGKLVSAEMFSMNTLQQKAADPENFNKLKPEIEMHIDQFLRVRLKDTFPMLSMLMGDKTINQLKTAFLLELENLFPVLMKNYITTLEKDLDIEKTVTQKIAGFPVHKMEELFYISAKKQLCKAQLAGALIGLLMGLIHILINTQLYS
ncbi:MAG: DUF445 domain-containing protein [Chitinophagaceae bacterium]|nr:DUF445 domain-containing protein [Chitinophagaceae bacterium]